MEDYFNLGSLLFEYLPCKIETRKGIVGAIQVNGYGEAYTLQDIKALKEWLELVIKQEEGS